MRQCRVVGLRSDGKPSCFKPQRMFRLVECLITAESKALYLGVQYHFLNYGRCVGTVLLMFVKLHTANIVLVHSNASTDGMFLNFIDGNRFHS
jgi:hypothetical protein